MSLYKLVTDIVCCLNVGAYGEMGTPLPIPNRAVKHLSVDGTWASAPGE